MCTTVLVCLLMHCLVRGNVESRARSYVSSVAHTQLPIFRAGTVALLLLRLLCCGDVQHVPTLFQVEIVLFLSPLRAGRMDMQIDAIRRTVDRHRQEWSTQQRVTTLPREAGVPLERILVVRKVPPVIYFLTPFLSSWFGRCVDIVPSWLLAG